MALLTPDKSLRFAIEVIFVLLGGLVFWIGHSGHFPYSFNPHGMGWLLLSIAMMIWGARALYQPGGRVRRYDQGWSRWGDWSRGLSLLLLGVLMVAISRVPFAWVGTLLSIGGLLLLLRGLAGCVLVFRPN
jgi:hypothetical protein